jgi:hypothetical protein
MPTTGLTPKARAGCRFANAADQAARSTGANGCPAQFGAVWRGFAVVAAAGNLKPQAQALVKTMSAFKTELG